MKTAFYRLFALSLLMLVFFFSCRQEKKEQDRPNILLIMSDNQSWNHVGCYGDPPLYGDVDAHMLHYPCPTKMFILANNDNPKIKPYFELGFGKRPAEEFYDLKNDPDEINNASFEKRVQLLHG